ncbi:MAG: LPS export ABC transporter periplasmic protein LptC [Gammaproteobacteria bacterium]|nr:LPS export ABC transporter periplasmic protein LptC [Gammaproteobacteria bacterium]
MKWGLTQTLLLTALLMAAITSLIWLDRPDILQDDESPKMSELQADYYLEGFETIRYSIDGSPEYRLEGDTLLHYPTHQASEIIAPQLVLNRPLQPSWTMASHSGWLEESDESIRLNGDVTILRGPVDDQPEITIKTSEITVMTREKSLATDADIEIQSRDWVLRSTGLKSNLTDGRLSLLSNVRARYESIQ